MGCFFGCLRARDGGSRPHLVSPSSKSSERSVSRNRLSSLFLDEDKGDYPSNDLRSPQVDKYLKDEAKFLKACGTIPQTSAEIRKASEKFDSEATTVDKLVKIDLESTSTYGRNKSVRFECECDASSSKYGDQNRKKLELLRYQSASKPSPNPTPLKLSDEMQTPGTVFPSNLEALANEKTRIRSEYVHSVLNPVENVILLNAKREEPFSSKEKLGELKESPAGPEEAIPKLERVKQTSLMKESEEEGSLSSWLKPKQFTIDDRIRNLQATSSKSPHSGKTLVDRPIIGMVAAHWNEDESNRISPKWWDGNGIPNSTNKYKEDQKVSWHATPFEERLEKALSAESLISQRKHVNQTPMAFDETDESDTALSQLRPTPHSKSVVSF